MHLEILFTSLDFVNLNIFVENCTGIESIKTRLIYRPRKRTHAKLPFKHFIIFNVLSGSSILDVARWIILVCYHTFAAQ